MARSFSLDFESLKCLNPINISGYARLLGPGGHPQIRGLIGAQVALRLHQERIITNADLWDAIGALNVFSGSLSISSEYILPKFQRIQLLRSIRKDCFDTTLWSQSVTLKATSLFQAPELADILTSDDKGKFTFNAELWEGWMQQIGVEPVENNVPSPAPPGAQPHPVAGELHPWAFGGLLHIAISNGRAFADPIDPSADPALLELLTLVWVQQDVARQAQLQLVEMMALSIAIITSKGSVNLPQLRKLMAATSRGMRGERIHIRPEALVSGWNFLAKVWTGQQTATDFKNLFQALGEVAAPFSPQFRLMCEGTASKGLTGILTIKQAMCTFNDFPWQELCEDIAQRTHQDELANARQFIKYLQGISEGDSAPREEAAAEEKPAYLWAGWTFALGTQKQEKAFQNSAYPNLLYAAIQIRIYAGEESLHHYQFKDSMVISQKDIINNWISQYFGSRCFKGTILRLASPSWCPSRGVGCNSHPS